MQTSLLQRKLLARLAEVRKSQLASAICDKQIEFMPPQDYLHSEEITLESCIFLCVMLCLSYPRGSWDENHETFQAVYQNLIGRDVKLGSIKYCRWYAGGVSCICGARYESSAVILTRECPSCYNDASKAKPYYCDYLIRLLQNNGMHRFVAESYVACAIACMESGNV